MKLRLAFLVRLICLLMVITLGLVMISCAPANPTVQTTSGTTKSSQATTTASTTAARKWPSDPNINNVGVLPAFKQTVKISVGVPQSAVIEKWDTNLQTLELEKDLNVDLSFVELPAKAAELIQKVELMIMAGGSELPDVIMSGLGGMSNLAKYGQMGMILPTNDYYANMSFYTEQGLANCKLVPWQKNNFLKYVTCYDGKIYGVATYFTSINNSLSESRIMIFEPWLTQLGLKMPQTTDELVTVLKAFKTQDPNKNGKADEIPLMGYADNVMSNLLRPLMNPFVYTQNNYYVDNNGKIEFAAVQDGWKKGLLYIKSLFDAGLISPLSLTQDNAQFNAVMNQPETIVGTIARVSASNLSQSDIRRLQYVIVDPLAGPTGLKQTTKNPGTPSIGMVITKNCKNPEAAFILGDYMCSDKISTWSRYGREGKEWEILSTPGKSEYDSLGYKGDVKILSSVWGTLQNIWWAQLGPTIGDGSQLTVRIAVGTTAGVYSHTIPIGATIGSSIKYANPKPILGLIYNEKEQEVVNEYMSTINSYVAETFAQFVTGAVDINTKWDSYVAEFNKMGLPDYLKAVQSAYDRMNK